MVFNKFIVRIIIICLVIGFSAFAFAWTLNQPYLVVAKYTFGAIFLFTIYVLINYSTQTNKRLTSVLSTFKEFDSIPDEHKGESFKQLKKSIDKILESIKEVKVEKEIEHRYFEYTLEKVPTAVISYDENNNVLLFNHAATKLLDIHRPSKTSSIIERHPSLNVLFEKSNEQKSFTLSIQNDSRILKLLGKNSIIILDGKPIYIATLIDITNQLTDEEIASYTKLIRVMTHEIMNSVSPLKSLLNTLSNQFSRNGESISPEEITQFDIENTVMALQAMQKRTSGLLQFVDSYRKLTKIPQPVKQIVQINGLFNDIIAIKKSDLQVKGIQISSSVEPLDLKANIDESLIIQVIINLINNAIDALSEKGTIEISARLNKDDQVEINIIDNGAGIEPDLLDKVFTPFFTTKKEGSGIGLSLSREIIRLHGGNISIKSEYKKGTTVILLIPSIESVKPRIK